MSIIAFVGLELMEHIHLYVFMSTITAVLSILQEFLGVLVVVSKIKCANERVSGCPDYAALALWISKQCALIINGHS